MRIQAFAMGLALAGATVGAARADDVLFTISGGDKTTTFELPLNPLPFLPVVPDYSFSIFSVPATVGGSQTTIANLTFFHDGMAYGGFAADNLFNFVNAPQFYSGSESSPTFLLGSYELVNSDTRKLDTVTVELVMGGDPPDPTSMAAPEPSTWAMLLLGFIGLGFAGYRKARTRTIN